MHKPHIRFIYHAPLNEYAGGYWVAYFAIRGHRSGTTFIKKHYGLTPSEALRNLAVWHWGDSAGV